MDITSRTAQQVLNDDAATQAKKARNPNDLADGDNQSPTQSRRGAAMTSHKKLHELDIDVQQIMQENAQKELDRYGPLEEDLSGTLRSNADTKRIQALSGLQEITPTERPICSIQTLMDVAEQRQHNNQTAAEKLEERDEVYNGNASGIAAAQGMQKIQTKEVSSSLVRRKKFTDNALKSPSIVDLSLGADRRQESVGTRKTNLKKKQSSTSPPPSKSPSKAKSKSPNTNTTNNNNNNVNSKKQPNMDLIGDFPSQSNVSGGGGDLLLNTVTGFHKSGSGDSDDSVSADKSIIFDTMHPPNPPNSNEVFQKTDIGFQIGNKILNTDFLMTRQENCVSQFPPMSSQRVNDTGSFSPTRTGIVEPKSPGGSSSKVQPFGKNSTVNQSNHNQRFQSNISGISNNSFERANKQYFLHQQKMLKKEAQKQRKQSILDQIELAKRDKSIHSGGQNIGNQYVDMLHGEELVFDSKEDSSHQRVIVKRTNSRDVEGLSPGGVSGSSRQDHMSHLRNVVVFDQKYEPNLTPIPGTNPQELSAYSTVMLSKNLHSPGLRSGSIPKNERGESSLQAENTFKLGGESVMSQTRSNQVSQLSIAGYPQPVSNKHTFFQTARQLPDSNKRQFHDQNGKGEKMFINDGIIVGKKQNLVPVVSKMKKINLLNNNQTLRMLKDQRPSHLTHNFSQNSFRGSPGRPDNDMANSSVKTFESPLHGMVPRPLNYAHVTQHERELLLYGNTDQGSLSGGIHASIESEKKGVLLKNTYSTDEHITEERNIEQGSGLTPSQLNQYAKVGNNNDSSPNIEYDDYGNATFSKKNDGRIRQVRDHKGGANKQDNLDGALQNLTNGQGRTKVNLKKSPPKLNQRKFSGSNASNAARAFKPPSPTPPAEVKRLLEVQKQGNWADRNASADTRTLIPSLDSNGNAQQQIIIQHESDSTTHFIELPQNTFMRQQHHQPEFSESGISEDTDLLTQQELMIKKNDPETYLYLVLLKKMKQNPMANITREVKQEIIQELNNELGQVKPITYAKINRDNKADLFDQEKVIKASGAGQEGSFETQEMLSRRKEYMNYCLQKIHSAIHDIPMDEKDEQKSPLNVQKRNTKLRRDKRKQFRDNLRQKYGVGQQSTNSITNARLSNGLSSVYLEVKDNSPFGLKTQTDIKKFEELNGMQLDSTTTMGGPTRNFEIGDLNNQSMLQTLQDYRQLSYTSWNAKDLQSQFGDDQQVSRQNTNTGTATNFIFQTKKALVDASNQVAQQHQLQLQASEEQQLQQRQNQSTMISPLNKILNVGSGELSQASFTATDAGFFENPSQLQNLPVSSTQREAGGVFGKRMLSIGNDTRQNLTILDEERTRNDFMPRKTSLQIQSSSANFAELSRNVKGFFSTKSRFNSVMYRGASVQRGQVGRHNNPKLIEIIAKLRDSSLNQDFMQKSVIRPEVIVQPKVKKIDQQHVDKHLAAHQNDNQGCPLLPVHKLDPVFQRKMNDVLKEPIKRPKEQHWQSVGIMLPILRQNASKNIRRNSNLDTDPEQYHINRTTMMKNTMHSPTDLTSPRISKQKQKVSRRLVSDLDDDYEEHRIQVKDILSAKQANEREARQQRAMNRKQNEIREDMLQSKKSEQLQTEMDYVAEQMALDFEVGSGDAL